MDRRGPAFLLRSPFVPFSCLKHNSSVNGATAWFDSVNSQSISSLALRKSRGLACIETFPAPDPFSGFRVLLGETQADLASAMTEWFLLGGHTVLLESDGLRILECLRLDHYDVILLEIALLGLDGIS